MAAPTDPLNLARSSAASVGAGSTFRTLLPNPRLTPRYAGVATFCRFPLLELVPPSSYPIDWIIYGVPFDSGVTFRPGARFGPRAIREASQYVKPYSIEHDVNICEELSLADGGDAPVKPYALRECLEGVCEFVTGMEAARANTAAAAAGASGATGSTSPTAGKATSATPAHAIDANTRFFAVGGDHSIAYANMKAAWIRRGKPVGGLPLIHFDSHLDTVDMVSGEKWTHASPFIRAIEDGIIDPKRMLSIGVKGPLNSARDLDYAREQGITIVTYEQWKRGVEGGGKGEGLERIDAFRRQLGQQEVYLTFDIDCIDPAFAPGTGTPSVGGFTSAEALGLLRRLGVSGSNIGGQGARSGLNLVGADVVEVLPDRDVSQITAFLAAHVIFEVLCLSAISRRSVSK